MLRRFMKWARGDYATCEACWRAGTHVRYRTAPVFSARSQSDANALAPLFVTERRTYCERHAPLTLEDVAGFSDVMRGRA